MPKLDISASRVRDTVTRLQRLQQQDRERAAPAPVETLQQTPAPTQPNPTHGAR